jgi:hypothetical protein
MHAPDRPAHRIDDALLRIDVERRGRSAQRIEPAQARDARQIVSALCSVAWCSSASAAICRSVANWLATPRLAASSSARPRLPGVPCNTRRRGSASQSSMIDGARAAHQGPRRDVALGGHTQESEQHGFGQADLLAADHKRHPPVLRRWMPGHAGVVGAEQRVQIGGDHRVEPIRKSGSSCGSWSTLAGSTPGSSGESKVCSRQGAGDLATPARDHDADPR